ncbi:hypothetical protein HRI_000554100 [Hibiscus trionum]|uniref:Uncharacterized protein n=1 Tax=Hibiscus trionum TaxID=183268 RepID=A0A9W7H159_HIBTR|nr:hypothetical protein HRI_000554100 [Hibiscus trionum]
MIKKSPEQGTQPVSSWSLSLRMTGDKYASYSELSPDLLDLHSFDTELLPEASNIYEPYRSIDKLSNRSRGMTENNVLKSISVDKEKANNVAKIKVVVRCLNASFCFLYCITDIKLPYQIDQSVV